MKRNSLVVSSTIDFHQSNYNHHTLRYRILKFFTPTDIKRPFKTYFVDIGPGWGLDNNKIRTIQLDPDESDDSDLNQRVPLVMIHGFASGIGNWLLNYDTLSSTLNRRIYAFDIIGFGRSSRPKMLGKSGDTDTEFIDSIERWRKAQNIEKFILLGHSFGGYLSTNYALRHPERVAHLILADPWGIQDKELSTNRKTFKFPILLRAVAYVFRNLAPLTILRASGPYGPRLIHKTRNDLKEKFKPILNEEASLFIDYIYHCNVQNPSGELAFKTLTIPYGWPKNPLIHEVTGLDPSVSLTFIYGARSWIETTPGEHLRHLFGPERVSLNIIQGSGHHVYADKYAEFNELVKEICSKL